MREFWGDLLTSWLYGGLALVVWHFAGPAVGIGYAVFLIVWYISCERREAERKAKELP